MRTYRTRHSQSGPGTTVAACGSGASSAAARALGIGGRFRKPAAASTAPDPDDRLVAIGIVRSVASKMTKALAGNLHALFYALSQAGRAVSAAHVQGQPFRSRGHGLRIGDPTGDLGATLVQPEGGPNRSFAMFCRATGSPGLTAATTLGALWAANPKLDVVATLGDREAPALELMQISGTRRRACSSVVTSRKRSRRTSTRPLRSSAVASGATPGLSTVSSSTTRLRESHAMELPRSKSAGEAPTRQHERSVSSRRDTADQTAAPFFVPP